MSGDLSTRSDLIDVTYAQLHSILLGQQDGVRPEQAKAYLEPRKLVLSRVTEPFGKPSETSRKAVESGNVTLPDGVALRVEQGDRDLVFALSKAFQIDEIQALILLRGLFYNSGLPPVTDELDTERMHAEVIEGIRPFYYSERLHALRVLMPLFRAYSSAGDPLNDVATDFLSKVIPDGPKFATEVLSTYLQNVRLQLPEMYREDPRGATEWAKQNVREQLVLLELLFWTMFGYVSCSGPLVVEIFEAAYSTHLGSSQNNSTLLLDDESVQLLQDCAVVWNMITVEVLELEVIGEPGTFDFSDPPSRTDVYYASPEHMKRLHDIVTAPAHSDSQYACTFIGWAFVLSRLHGAASSISDPATIPAPWNSLLEHINPTANLGRSYTKEVRREPAHVAMARAALQPEVGLLKIIEDLLTKSAVFVTSYAMKNGSSITDPNAIACRSVLKGLIISLVELLPVEQIPSFESLVEVWVALFGRSEPQTIAAICSQFWTGDWNHGFARRAIFDVARVRFPIQVRPLLRLARAMTGAGFLETDPLYSQPENGRQMYLATAGDRALCARMVYEYLARLPTYSQVIPVSALTGAQALYERQSSAPSNSKASTSAGTSGPGLTYVNLRPLRLPGGSILPARSTGRLLNGDAAEYVVVAWQHEHSGWKVVLEMLTDYVRRRKGVNQYSEAGASSRRQLQQQQEHQHHHHHQFQQPKTLTIEDTGMEFDAEGDEGAIVDAFDLIRSLIHDNPQQATLLMHHLEDGPPVVSHTHLETQPPGLVQLTTMILEDALSRSNSYSRSRGRVFMTKEEEQRHGESLTRLITSAIGVLSELLTLEDQSHKVWLYIRSTTTLFGSDVAPGFASVALSAERATGTYTMTLSLLHLIERLFTHAFVSISAQKGKLQQVKEEVLLRALRFVHTEIWVEHMSWKYAQLGDRFEIGTRVAGLFVQVLENSPPTTGLEDNERPFPVLSQAVADILLFKAASSTISPIVSSIASGHHAMKMLFASRRHGDVRRLVFLLQANLHLSRLVLTAKMNSGTALTGKACLLEQALSARTSGGGMTGFYATLVRMDPTIAKHDPIDALTCYIRDRSVGLLLPLEAAKVLCALISSLSSLSNGQPSPPTIIGHLSNPELAVGHLVRIIHHPYDDLNLRKTVWAFASLAVDKEPALATLFVAGRTRGPGEFKKQLEDKEKEKGNVKAGAKDMDKEAKEQGIDKGKGKEKEKEDQQDQPVSRPSTSALDAALEILVTWKELWEANPLLLACIFRFLDTVWQHYLEHKSVLDPLRGDKDFWERVIGVACEEVGPVPAYETTETIMIDGILRSNVHEAVQTHAYRTLAKSFAIHIITHDIGLHIQSHGSEVPLSKPRSYLTLEPYLKSQDQLTDLLAEAAPSSYAPELYDKLTDLLKRHFPGLTLQQLEVQAPMVEREYGDGFRFSVPLLRARLGAYPPVVNGMYDPAEEVDRLLLSVNLNLSLVHSESALLASWGTLLKQVIPYLRTDAGVRPAMLAIAASLSFDISKEAREGDMMAAIHGERLLLVLSLLEIAWFSSSDKKAEIEPFIDLVKNVRNIILNDAQAPSRSFLSNLPNPFHRVLLQIIFFCVKQARSLLGKPKALVAQQRLDIALTVEPVLNFVIDSLNFVFNTARTRNDVDLDRDMELLVAVFEQCTRSDIDVSSVHWLARCQETNVIRASLELYVHIDLVGLSDLPLLLARKQPLYAPHILLFHMALVTNPAAAERFASEGVLSAYSNNFISSAISTGRIDVVLPELPGQRSPAHLAYCSMISIVAMVITALGRQNHYFDSEACGFVQFYGDQISRALSWTIGDPITLPLVEEIDQVINLFYAIATCVPTSAKSNPVTDKVLRVFTNRALHLLQQVNYAITHPNHLASLYEPVTHEERVRLEQAQSTQPDPTKRPFVMHLIHRFFQISASLVGALVVISKADKVLLSGVEDWPVGEALIVPHSKVVLGEPASLGTLLELGNRTLDILRNLVQRPPGQRLSDSPDLPGSYTTALGVKEGVIVARRNLEEILLYSVTQLAMWLSKPDFDSTPQSMEADMEGDHPQPMDISRADVIGGKDRRLTTSTAPSRPTMTMAERLRRGMTGEMAGDLQSLLTKSKPIIIASDTIIGKPSVDLTQVLLNFLHDRITGAS